MLQLRLSIVGILPEFSYRPEMYVELPTLKGLLKSEGNLHALKVDVYGKFISLLSLARCDLEVSSCFSCNFNG